MSTNYFNPVSYRPRPATQTPVQMPNATSITLPSQNANWTNVTGWSPTGQVAAPNQGLISAAVASLYGTGTPGQPGYVPGINERVGQMFGRARNNARDALRGYGGVSFRADDPSTPNVDESLMIDYQPDQLGRNERQAVLAARAQANARGMLSSGFGDQMIGAALQRVGEEARQIVNQYSQQINQIADQYFLPGTGMVWQTLGQIQSLYGADTTWAADQELQRPAPPPAPEPAASPPPAGGAPSAPARAPGTVIWTGRTQPTTDWADRQFGPGNYRIVIGTTIVNGRRVTQWRVVAR